MCELEQEKMHPFWPCGPVVFQCVCVRARVLLKKMHYVTTRMGHVNVLLWNEPFHI